MTTLLGGKRVSYTGTREAIYLCIGGGGVRIGEQFWRGVAAEHKLDHNGSNIAEDNEKNSIGDRDVLFRESSDGSYIPRSIFFDFDGESIDQLTSCEAGKLFSPSNCISSNHSCSNNWARGHYSHTGEAFDEFKDQMRKEVEYCDSLDSINFIHTIGGGTGSGFGTYALAKFMETYYYQYGFHNHVVFPSTDFNLSNILEPYNATLSIHQLVENSTLTNCFDNAAIQRQHNKYNGKKFLLEEKDFTTINSYLAEFMLGITSPYRFPMPTRSSSRKVETNLIPFPRLHFMLCSMYPFQCLSKLPKPDMLQVPNQTKKKLDIFEQQKEYVKNFIDSDHFSALSILRSKAFQENSYKVATSPKRGLKKNQEFEEDKECPKLEMPQIGKPSTSTTKNKDGENKEKLNVELSKGTPDYEKLLVNLMSHENVLASAKAYYNNFGKSKKEILRGTGTECENWMTAHYTFRGPNFLPFETKKAISHFRIEQMKSKKRDVRFEEWITWHHNSGFSSSSSRTCQNSAYMRGNTKAVQFLFRGVSEAFCSLFRKKAFLHYYLNEGMDEMEFTEAESNLNDLISEFQTYSTPYWDEEEGEEEEEEEEEEEGEEF